MESRHKSEIREKRAKLAELKEARARREKERRATGLSSGTQTPLERGTSSKQDLNDLVNSLLSAPSISPSGTPRKGEASGRSSQLEDMGAGSDHGSMTVVNTDGFDSSSLVGQTIPDFSDVTVEVFEFAPRPKLVYEKGIQTNFFSTGTSTDSPPTQNGTVESLEEAGGVGRESDAELRARFKEEFEAEKQRLDREIAEEREKLEKELNEERVRGLSGDKLTAVYNDPEFQEFLDDASKVALRALSDNYDYLRDYSISGMGTGDMDDADRQRVRLACTFWDERWNKNRSITAVDWSPKFPELCVASYNKNPMALNEPDGIACVWNLHLLTRPEYTFHAQSDVLSVSFTPFHPNYIIGGTYSGQILLWDTRNRSPNPSLKTPLSATAGHTHPIYSLSIVGTQNAHNLLSASTDGTVCAWVLDMLAQPQETLQLVLPNASKTDEVAVTCMAFSEGETTTFCVGTEEGNVYAANRHDRAGSKAGLIQSEIYRGHGGPVMGINFHPLHGNIDFSDLFLTCGVDWTVKLWRSKGVNSGKRSGQGVQNIAPLASMEESDDYVFDVKWHPHHPAVFGTVDGIGKFDLWNLNVDTEVPMVSTLVNPSAPHGLNKLAWDKEGKRAAVGSSDGNLHVYEVGSEMITPRESDWDQLRKTIQGLGSGTGIL